jgi:hypothetical protein
MFKCWQCEKSLTVDSVRNNDGFCKYCGAEIELENKYMVWNYSPSEAPDNKDVLVELKSSTIKLGQYNDVQKVFYLENYGCVEPGKVLRFAVVEYDKEFHEGNK